MIKMNKCRVQITIFRLRLKYGLRFRLNFCLQKEQNLTDYIKVYRKNRHLSINNQMSTQIPEEQWGLIYFRKKAQFNEYVEFKSKSFQYQKVLGKLHFLSTDDDQTNKKQIKQYIKALNGILEELKNILSEIHQEMKFLKLQSMASLVESFQQLIASLHHYNIEDKKNKIEYGRKSKDDEKDQQNENCHKCLGSINKINLKKLYEEITTTDCGLQNNENLKMTKEQRRKMISQLDEYDILIAQKQNYLRKVNSVLENKGKVGQLSNHDKTYNFLSEYLSTIQKIQQRRAKSYNKNKLGKQHDDNKWEQQSYKHILDYIKRVLFEHFVNECSGPVKKLFEKINIDNIFKSYQDHAGSQIQIKPQTVMQNHQTQTLAIPEVQQLKMIEKRMEFKLKEIAQLKLSKDDVEKKYISTLDLNRKIQSQLFDQKKQKKWIESQFKTSQQNLTVLTEKYNQKIQNYEEEKRKTFQCHINERQKILRVSKQLETQFRMLQTQHKKCESQKNKPKSIPKLVVKQTQTEDLQAGNSQNGQDFESMTKSDSFPFKRRKSNVTKVMFNAYKGERKGGFFKDFQKEGFFEAFRKQSIIDQKSRQDSVRSQKSLHLQSCVLSIFLSPDGKEVQSVQHFNQRQIWRQKMNQGNKSSYKFNRTTKRKSLKTQEDFSILKENQNSTGFFNQQGKGFPIIGKDKRIKISMTSFKRMRTQKSTVQDNRLSNTSYKFSNFNRFSEVQDPSRKHFNNLTLPEQVNELNRSSQINGAFNKQKKIFQISQRLYKKKQKQPIDLPFERVIEKGKEKFYIKKISRQSINYKSEKQRIKQISQILKPYVYNNNQNTASNRRRQPPNNLKSIRQRLSQLSQSNKRFSIEGGQSQSRERRQSLGSTKNVNSQQNSKRNSVNHERLNSEDHNNNRQPKKTIGKDISDVQNIIETQFAYLKAVGFIDFLMKIGKENKKLVKAMNKIQIEVKNKFKTPTSLDLDLFGGTQQAQDYVKGKNFWTIDSLKQNMMIYNKNDGLSNKIQKYFNLLKRANPELYSVLIRFLSDPIFAVYGKQAKNAKQVAINSEDNCFIKDLFNQLQKYHKIKHNECTHIVDFLEKIGFYRYTYF